MKKHSPHRPGRSPYGQIRLSEEAIARCRQAEEASGLSPQGVVQQVVEGWSRGFVWGFTKNRKWAGWGAVFGLLALVLVRCVPLPPTETLTKPMPSAPLEGQAKPPCKKPMVEKVGGCWLAVREEDGTQVKGCLHEEFLYEDKNGYCWVPVWPKPVKPGQALEP